MRFVHAADIHLDSPLRGLENYEGAPVDRIRLATRAATQHLVDVCLTEQVQLLLIAGDLFDADWKDFRTALFIANQLRRLEPAGVRVFLILGNHDSYQELTRRVPWPSNVQVLSHREPETVILDELGVAIHGMSFPRREVTENLVPRYPAPLPGLFNIGLLHTSASGHPEHGTYAPCDVGDLVAKGYDYWALGHVHQHLVLHESPHVVFAGTPQGRHIRETGRKGVVLVTVRGQQVIDLSFQETDVLRWYRLEVALAPEDGMDELTVRTREALQPVLTAADGRLAAVRLEITGRCAAHHDLVQDSQRQQALTDLRSLAGEFGGDLWIEKVRFRTQSPLNVTALREGPDLIGELLRANAALLEDPAELLRFSETLLAPLQKKLATVPRNAGNETLDFQSPQQIAEWVRDAERLLLERLVESKS